MREVAASRRIASRCAPVGGRSQLELGGRARCRGAARQLDLGGLEPCRLVEHGGARPAASPCSIAAWATEGELLVRGFEVGALLALLLRGTCRGEVGG